MNDGGKGPKANDPSYQILLIGVLLTLVCFQKFRPALEIFWEHHHGTVWFCGALALFAISSAFAVKAWNRYALRCQERGITARDDTAVYLGTDASGGEDVYLKESFRTMHAQVIGTTNAGKTESVILPWAIQDIRNGSGVLIVDGKSDGGFLNKLYAYTNEKNRTDDFRLFSLAHPGPSSSFNPLKGDSAQEVTERVFSSFTFENEYYKNIQYRIFLNFVRLIYAQKEIPTFSLVHRFLTDEEELKRWAEACVDEPLQREMLRFMKLSEKEREERTSGLETMLSHFTVGEVAPLFEETAHSINFDEALRKNQIIYFQLPTMYFPFLAAATGKLVLQCFQSAVSKRQIKMGGEFEKAGKVLFMPPR